MSDEIGQPSLLPPETLAEAMRDLSRHPAVGGWKQLACRLKPELADDPAAAGRWLSDALDDEKRDVFHELHNRRAISVGVEVGCDVLWRYYCEATQHEYSPPSKAKSRRLMLLEERERIAGRDRQIQQEIEELDRQETVRELRDRREARS